MTVLELLEKKKISYQISGNDYKVCCLNPEHDDSNPSMRIDKVLGVFNCLSCGFKGNIFYHFGEKIDKLDTAREKLKRKLNQIRSESIGLRIPVDSELLSSDFRVSVKTLMDFEAFRSSNTDYSGRVMFPIRDIKGRIVCFVGRSEDVFDPVRYKVFPPHSKVPLFPLNKIEPFEGKILLVEGIFDLLNLYDNGYRNVLCSFGTNTINKEKLNILKILGVSGVDIMFDPDKAGREAAEKVKDLAEEMDFQVRNINLRNSDPGDLTPNHAINLRKKLYGI